MFQNLCKLAVCFCLIISSIYSNEKHSAIERVIQRAYTAIAFIEDGKIFLKPEMLSLKQGQIYVEGIDGVEFAIPVVFSTKELFPHVQVGDFPLLNIWKCSCGTWNHNWDNPTCCWRCGQPR